MYESFGIEHEHLLRVDTQGHIDIDAGQRGGTGSVDEHRDLSDLFFLQFEGVEQCGGTDDGRSVLIIVHHRDVHLLF